MRFGLPGFNPKHKWRVRIRDGEGEVTQTAVPPISEHAFTEKEHPDITSASERGWGGHGKADILREVA